MANIPVRHKEGGGIPWWGWLLLALAVIALLWVLFANPFDQEEAAPVTAPPAAERQATPAAGQPAGQQPAAGGQATALPATAIGQPDRLDDFVGQTVRLQNVQVQDVVSDRAFWIGPSENERLFVVLDRSIAEQNPNINEGETITLVGTLREVNNVDQLMNQLNLDQQTASALRNQQFFLHANQVSGSSQP